MRRILVLLCCCLVWSWLISSCLLPVDGKAARTAVIFLSLLPFSLILYRPEGAIAGSMSTGLNNTDQAGIQIHSLTQQLQLATSTAHLGVWEWNIHSNTLIWDERMLEIFGLAREAFSANIDTWIKALHPEDKKEAIAACKAALRGQRDLNASFRIVHGDGTVKHVRAKGLMLEGSDGTPERMIGTCVDITDLVTSEEEKAQLQRQLNQSQKMESIGLLAGGVAHDFNNKLSVILGNAEISLTKIEQSHPVYNHLQEIRQATEMSAELTRQLLAFARKQRVSPRVLDLNDVIGRMLRMLRRVIGENVELVWIPEPVTWPIKIDPAQVDQIIANLCVNARDAIAGNGKLIIRTENYSLNTHGAAFKSEISTGEYVVLTVSDDGEGMDDETKARMFEPFFTTKAVGRGTGLGLATVYGIIRQNNGHIDVSSEPGMGTTFRIYLPRYTGGIEELREYSNTGSVRGSERVLLVEDDKRILRIGKEMLLSLGYEVLEADCPEKALALAREHGGDIDLLVTDIVMPKMNGRELFVWLQPLCPKLRCLFISGYTADTISSQSLIEPGVPFLQKPFSLNDFAGKVREALMPGGIAGSPHLT